MIPWQEKCPQLSPETYLLILYFGIDVNLLETQGKRYPWPRPPWCPRCRSPRLWGHGYVGRFFDGFQKALLAEAISLSRLWGGPYAEAPSL